MKYITTDDVVRLHRKAVEQFGGKPGIHSEWALNSSVNQPLATFDGEDLYPDIVAKAAALGFFLVANHPFNDGNKRVGHLAMKLLLRLNGFTINATVDERERVFLTVAAGQMDISDFISWVRAHTTIANHKT